MPDLWGTRERRHWGLTPKYQRNNCRNLGCDRVTKGKALRWGHRGSCPVALQAWLREGVGLFHGHGHTWRPVLVLSREAFCQSWLSRDAQTCVPPEL